MSYANLILYSRIQPEYNYEDDSKSSENDKVITDKDPEYSKTIAEIIRESL